MGLESNVFRNSSNKEILSSSSESEHTIVKKEQISPVLSKHTHYNENDTPDTKEAQTSRSTFWNLRMSSRNTKDLSVISEEEIQSAEDKGSNMENNKRQWNVHALDEDTSQGSEDNFSDEEDLFAEVSNKHVKDISEPSDSDTNSSGCDETRFQTRDRDDDETEEMIFQSTEESNGEDEDLDDIYEGDAKQRRINRKRKQKHQRQSRAANKRNKTVNSRKRVRRDVEEQGDHAEEEEDEEDEEEEYDEDGYLLIKEKISYKVEENQEWEQQVEEYLDLLETRMTFQDGKMKLNSLDDEIQLQLNELVNAGQNQKQEQEKDHKDEDKEQIIECTTGLITGQESTPNNDLPSSSRSYDEYHFHAAYQRQNHNHNHNTNQGWNCPLTQADNNNTLTPFIAEDTFQKTVLAQLSLLTKSINQMGSNPQTTKPNRVVKAKPLKTNLVQGSQEEDEDELKEYKQWKLFKLLSKKFNQTNINFKNGNYNKSSYEEDDFASATGSGRSRNGNNNRKDNRGKSGRNESFIDRLGMQELRDLVGELLRRVAENEDNF